MFAALGFIGSFGLTVSPGTFMGAAFGLLLLCVLALIWILSVFKEVHR